MTRGIRLLIDSLGSGGAQRQLVNLALGLQARGHRVSVLVYFPDDFYRPMLDAAGIQVLRVRKRSRFSTRVFFELRDYLVDSSVDAVIAFLSTPSLYAEVCCALQRRIKVIVSERSYTLDASNWATLQQFHRLADWVTTNSHHRRADLQKQFRFLRGRISTIYNGIDTNAFSPPAVGRSVRCTGPDLLVVGRVEERKNALLLVEALGRLRERTNIRAAVRWAGRVDANPAGTAFVDRIGARIAELDLNDQWSWLGERTDVAELMRTHDALVHPSYLEGLPNAICEALASGLPVLASNVLDHPRLVADGEAGLLFNPRHADDLASAIERFHSFDANRRAEMSRAARMFAERELSIEHFVDGYEALVLSLTTGARSFHSQLANGK